MMVTIVLTGLIYHICEMYIDDCIVYGNTEVEFVLCAKPRTPASANQRRLRRSARVFKGAAFDMGEWLAKK